MDLLVAQLRSGAGSGGVAQMGWERRGNHEYYYRKERDGSRVKSVYVGRGEIAHMISQIQQSSGLLESLARRNRSPEIQQAEADLDRIATDLHTLTQGILLAAGFHTHKRQWRKIRDGRKNNSECH